MLTIHTIRAAFACAALALPSIGLAGQWYFNVTNDTESRITKLEVSENKKDWGNFDIGRGIDGGDTVKLEWDSSTDSESCDQWIRATFSDGSKSPATKQNFCADLDNPIVFGEE